MEVAGTADGFDLDRIDSLVVRLMGHAVMARAYRDAIERDPALTAGFGRLAARHSARAATLAEEISAGASRLNGYALARRAGVNDL